MLTLSYGRANILLKPLLYYLYDWQGCHTVTSYFSAIPEHLVDCNVTKVLVNTDDMF